MCGCISTKLQEPDVSGVVDQEMLLFWYEARLARRVFVRNTAFRTTVLDVKVFREATKNLRGLQLNPFQEFC